MNINFKDTIVLQKYTQAIALTDYTTIKNGVIALLEESEQFSNETLLAIKLAAEKLIEYPDSEYMLQDGVFQGILNLDWDTVNVTNIPALTIEERFDLINTVLAVCNEIVKEETSRLRKLYKDKTNVVYGAGYSGSDFFGIFYN